MVCSGSSKIGMPGAELAGKRRSPATEEGQHKHKKQKSPKVKDAAIHEGPPQAKTLEV